MPPRPPAKPCPRQDGVLDLLTPRPTVSMNSFGRGGREGRPSPRPEPHNQEAGATRTPWGPERVPEGGGARNSLEGG